MFPLSEAMIGQLFFCTYKEENGHPCLMSLLLKSFTFDLCCWHILSIQILNSSPGFTSELWNIDTKL